MMLKRVLRIQFLWKARYYTYSRSTKNPSVGRNQQWHRHVIADLQKKAVAEWFPSFNSVRGPMERLGIVWVPYT